MAEEYSSEQLITLLGEAGVQVDDNVGTDKEKLLELWRQHLDAQSEKEKEKLSVNVRKMTCITWKRLLIAGFV